MAVEQHAPKEDKNKKKLQLASKYYNFILSLIEKASLTKDSDSQ